MGILPSPLLVARISKTYGTAGEVVVKFSANFKELEPVFIYFDKLPVPFYIESFTQRGNSGAIVKFTTINSHKEALSLVGKEIFISADDIDEQQLPDFYDNNEQIAAAINGFTLLDEQGRVIGQIKDYIQYPDNPCIMVHLAEGLKYALSDEKSDFAEIPFNDNLIIEVNPKKKIIKIEIAQGLIL